MGVADLLTTVALFSALRVEVRNPESVLDLSGRRAELEADAFLRRLAQMDPPGGRWRLRLQASSTSGVDLACDIELEPFQFVSFRELLAAGLALRPKSGFMQHKHDLDAAESLVGRPIYPGRGARGLFWMPPKAVHVDGHQAPVERVPFAKVSVAGVDLDFAAEGPDSEDEAARVISEWLKPKDAGPWVKLAVTVCVTLADGRLIRANLQVYRPSFGKTELRWALVHHLLARSQSHFLTESHRRLLAMLAQHLDGGTSFLALHKVAPPGQFRCPCTAHVATRTARLANERVQVPALHASSVGPCRFVVDAYQDLDSVPTSTTLDLGNQLLEREAWWQGELRAQGLVPH